MDLVKVLADLRAELGNLDAAIATLERLQARGRRRGRPPHWLQKSGKTARPGKAKLQSRHAGETPPQGV
jgi:hypothetical protein